MMYEIPLAPPHLEILGSIALERSANGIRPLRLSLDAITRLPDDWIARQVRQTSGIRLRFATAARRPELDVRALRPLAIDAEGAPIGPEPAPLPYDLLVDGAPLRTAFPEAWGHQRLDWAARTGSEELGPVTTLVFDDLPGHQATMELWLPQHESAVLVALRADAALHVVPAQPRWVHHGSSISHGSGAASPSRTWPAVAARAAGLDLVNLGFGGNALVDPFAARAMRDARADLISVKLGINVVNHDAMRRRVFRSALEGFIDTIRDGHPHTPLVVITPILCPMVETLPGPTSAAPDADGNPWFTTAGTAEELVEGKLSLELIRDDLEHAVRRRREQGDASIHHLDGRVLYGEADWAQHPLPDNLHPGAHTHDEMGRRFAAWLTEARLTPPQPLVDHEPSDSYESGVIPA